MAVSKKIAILFIAVLICVALSCTLVACDDNKTANVPQGGGDSEENNTTEWNFDSDNHWMTNKLTDNDGEKTSHIFGADGVCVCGFIEGLQFEYAEDFGWFIFGYNGKDRTELIIPPRYNKEPIRGIGQSAFKGCSRLESVIIPESLTQIGADAFSECASLKYNEYADALYLGNAKNPYVTLVKVKDSTLSQYEIHKNTLALSVYAFKDCANLTIIGIPYGIREIGVGAFENCTALTSITILTE